jgi:predicted DNA binding protein
MRYLTVLVSRSDGDGFHPLGTKLGAEQSITREAIHHVDLLADGTVLLFAEGSGKRDRYEAIMRESPRVDDYLVSGQERWMAVSRFEATPPIRRLLELERESELVVETPIRITDDGSLRVTYVGRDAAFRGIVRSVGEDADLTFDVVETGSYDPDGSALLRVLTTRQQEVLEAAVETGYYGAPRRATQADVAERVGIAPTTAGEHLRKIEAQVFDVLVT